MELDQYMSTDVKGYNPLSKHQIEGMNVLKEKEAEIVAILRSYQTAMKEEYDPRCLASAITNIQQGFMWANRSIAQPREKL